MPIGHYFFLEENLDEVKRQVGQPSPRRITVKAGRRRSNAMSFRPARRPPSRAASGSVNEEIEKVGQVKLFVL